MVTNSTSKARRFRAPPLRPVNTHSKSCPSPQLDTKWATDPGFVMYDFTKPEDIPQELRGTFDMVVVDPPFITKEVGASSNYPEHSPRESNPVAPEGREGHPLLVDFKGY